MERACKYWKRHYTWKKRRNKKSENIKKRKESEYIQNNLNKINNSNNLESNIEKEINSKCNKSIKKMK